MSYAGAVPDGRKTPAYRNNGRGRAAVLQLIDPAGRALLALLACADEELSARRFAEYVSLGQVPLTEASDADMWSPPAEELVEAMLPPEERAEDVQPEEEASATASRGETERDIAGTLRAPWRWEDLIVEAAVITLGELPELCDSPPHAATVAARKRARHCERERPCMSVPPRHRGEPTLCARACSVPW